MDATVLMIEKEEKKVRRITWLKGMVYVLPSLALFAIFVIYPFIRTIIQSFYLSDNRGFLTVFVGLDNYIDLFTNPLYLQSLKTTCLYTILTVPLTVVISLLLAVLSSYNWKGMGIFRTIFTSTMGISVAAGSLFWNYVFHPTVGLLNAFIIKLGGEAIGWLIDPKYALVSISIVTIWMNIGFSYLILMGGIKNIDNSFYESADIVGGGFWYRLRKITIPLLSPSLFFVFVTSIIGAFKAFGVIHMLTSGGPMNSTNLLVYSLYKEAFVNFQYGTATAQGVVLFFIIFVISTIQTKLTEKWVTYQ